MTVASTSGVESYAATVYSLVCNVDSHESYVTTVAEANIVWVNSGGDPVISGDRVTVSETERVTGGGYRSTLTFNPLSLTDSGHYICIVVITPDTSWPFVTASSPGEDTLILDVLGKLANTL